MASESLTATPIRVRLVRLSPGHYRLDGVTHTHGGCDGQVYAERFGPSWDSEVWPDGRAERVRLEASWECYCETCGECDVNGWPTLKDCKREAQAYWMNLPPSPPVEVTTDATQEDKPGATAAAPKAGRRRPRAGRPG